MEDVGVTVTWTDAVGTYVNRGDSFVDYDPAMPGQTPPFKVIEIHNPRMSQTSIEFTQGVFNKKALRVKGI